jgi:hypothetical protein
MPSVLPNISTLPLPATQVTSQGATSYETIQTSISGGYAFLVLGIYQYATNNAQLNEPITLKRYDANGVKNLMVLTPTIDPYQFTSALNLPTMKYNYVLDGQNGFYPTIKANTTVSFRIRVETTSASDSFPETPNNYQTLDFFENFDFS